MIYILVSLSIVFVLALVGYEFLRRQKIRSFDAAWETNYPRSAFMYCGKTVLFYNNSHGNQLEYLDPEGNCFLWYPGNSGIVVGRWRRDNSQIYFQYGSNTFNPVTNVTGGSWESCPLDHWTSTIVEAVTGDLFDLQEGLPFVLKAHPMIRSINKMAASGLQA